MVTGMRILQGNSVSAGYAKGPLLIVSAGGPPEEYIIDDICAEICRFTTAREAVVKQLQELQEEAKQAANEDAAKIFEVHSMMLEDAEYIEAVEDLIRSKSINTESAVYEAGKMFSELFASMEDSYMKERAADVLDISRKLIMTLSQTLDKTELDKPVIICADELLPSQTLMFDKSKIMGFVTRKGCYFSHAAILARTMGIPAIFGIENFERLKDGQFALLDGTAGILTLEPSEEYCLEFEEKCIQEMKHKELLNNLICKKAETLDGKKIELCANISNLKELEAAIASGADGIGLFRSEFIYMESSSFPTEEQQFLIYRKALEMAQGKRVIIRTLDLGADKHAPYFSFSHEENPALGYRAIRVCFDRPDIFDTQLRALLRASAYGKLGIMFPMITGPEEAEKCFNRTKELTRILRDEGYMVNDDIELGVMIETPAAAIVSDILAGEVDFFSIGTNDLTQYTLAVDRMNTKLSYLYNPGHMAVLRLIRMVAENAHRAGIWVGICGESAADPALTEYYLTLGIDELSVAPSALLPLKEKINSIRLYKS